MPSNVPDQEAEHRYRYGIEPTLTIAEHVAAVYTPERFVCPGEVGHIDVFLGKWVKLFSVMEGYQESNRRGAPEGLVPLPRAREDQRLQDFMDIRQAGGHVRRNPKSVRLNQCGNGVGELPEEPARTSGKTVQKLSGSSEHDMDEGSDSDDETVVGGSPGAQNYRRTFSDDDMDDCFRDGYSTRGTTPDSEEDAYPPPHWPDNSLAEYLLTHRDSWYKFAVKKGFKGRVQDLMFTRFLKRPAMFVAETKEYRVSEINSLPICTAVVEAHCLGDDDSEDKSESEGMEHLYMCAHRLIKWDDPLDRDLRTSNLVVPYVPRIRVYDIMECSLEQKPEDLREVLFGDGVPEPPTIEVESCVAFRERCMRHRNPLPCNRAAACKTYVEHTKPQAMHFDRCRKPGHALLTAVPLTRWDLHAGDIDPAESSPLNSGEVDLV